MLPEGEKYGRENNSGTDCNAAALQRIQQTEAFRRTDYGMD
jgi:hypothetical protein